MKNILILSGAGLSAPSGIRTFRDTNGLWEEFEVMEVCSIQGFEKDRKKVMDFYDARRADVEDKVPNEAHFMISRLKEKYPENVSVLTQNVDDLLEKANCKDVVHLHGTLTDLRCEECGEVFNIGYDTYKDKICPKCKSSFVRHNVVMFGEAAPMYQTLQTELTKADLLVCIGTSGQVLDVGYFAKIVPHSILNNLDFEPILDKAFEVCFYESADMVAPQIEKICEDFMIKGEIIMDSI